MITDLTTSTNVIATQQDMYSWYYHVTKSCPALHILLHYQIHHRYEIDICLVTVCIQLVNCA